MSGLHDSGYAFDQGVSRNHSGSGRQPALNEIELTQWAEQAAISSKIDKFSGYGAIVFWVLVACLLTARIMLFNASDLRPAPVMTKSNVSSIAHSANTENGAFS